MMRSGVVIVVGSGGREHAIAQRLLGEAEVRAVHAWPGNLGMALDGVICHSSGDIMDFAGIGMLAKSVGAEMVIIGPEGPLVGGVADYFRNDFSLRSVALIGPSRQGAQLEGSKSFAKEFMQRHGIPTARYRSFDASQSVVAKAFLRELEAPYVIKADGLAAGKGVAISATLEEAESTLDSYFGGRFAEASSRVVIEEFLEGIELSVFVVTDGRGGYVLLPEAKDYKRIGENDTGLNTGGMGSVSPVKFADEAFMDRVVREVVRPTLVGLQKDYIDYKGFIFFGLMRLKSGAPYVIEYNARLGDPETQAVLPRLDESLMEILRLTAHGELECRTAKCVEASCVTVTLAAEGYPEGYRKGMRLSVDASAVPLGGSVVYAGVTAGPDGGLVTSGGRVASARGMGATLEEAAKCAYDTARAVHFAHQYMRNDITKDLL